MMCIMCACGYTFIVYAVKYAESDDLRDSRSDCLLPGKPKSLILRKSEEIAAKKGHPTTGEDYCPQSESSQHVRHPKFNGDATKLMDDNQIEMRSDFIVCDYNPPYGICMRFALCAFLVAQVQICRSPDFVIYMLNDPSSNCCRLLRRLVVLYEGEISHHLDPPSRHSHRTRSALLWALIRILYLDTARFIDLLYVRSPF